LRFCTSKVDMRDDDPEPFNNIMQHNNPMLRKSIIIHSIRPQHIHSIRQHNPFLIKSHHRQPLGAVLSVPPAAR
jgi:hypothetical protein